MGKTLKLVIGVVIFVLINGCQDIYDNPKYKRPEWLAGKLYVQVEENNLNTFKKCLDATQWGKILNSTGFYSVFAPTDEAFTNFFQTHPKYKKFEDFLVTAEDSIYLDGLVRYHLIQDAWSKFQLTNMTPRGFYDKKNDINNSYFSQRVAYKRQTAFIDLPYREYVNEDVFNKFYERTYDQIVSVPSTSSVERYFVSDGPKYAPFFYKNFMDALDYTSQDYEFYFNRPFDESKIYFAGAEVISDQIPAENGFLYTIDKVVEPLPNLYQAIKLEYGGVQKYQKFIDLMNEFSYVIYEDQRTREQDGFNEGKAGVKNLFSKVHLFRYSAIDIDNELTSSSPGLAMFSGTSMVVPNNEAMEKMFNEIILSTSGYNRHNNLDEVPSEVKELIITSSYITSPIYKKEILEGFLNYEGDSLFLSDEDIETKLYCSNGVFIGLKRPIIPKAFSSVAGPILLRTDFEPLMYALRSTRMLDELKNLNKKYSFFALDGQTSLDDSTLILEDYFDNFFTRKVLLRYNFEFDPPQRQLLSTSDLIPLISNQICIGEIEGIAKYEFLKNLTGKYVTIDNVNQTILGSSASSVGYNGSRDTVNKFSKIDEPVVNGATYKCCAWLLFNSTPSLFAALRGNGFVATIPTDQTPNRNSSYFIELCIKAGLANVNGFIASQFSTAGPYTVFAPGDQVLKDYEAFENVKLTSLSTDELRKFLLYHFVQGAHIFTDGKQPSGTYRTLRVDEKSSDLGKVYSTVNIETGYDIIRVLNKSGDEMATVLPENQSNPNATFTRTNKIAYVTIPDPDNANLGSSTFASSVIHEISSVLVYEK